QRGREVVIFGDTRYRAEHADFCRDADVLVHEATFADSDRAAAHQHGHATAAQAATLARDANVGVLYLNHISAKYSGDAVAVLENEARAVFANSHIVHDFQQVDIPRK
uniref:MBL fold metallo-hydrolase n=1 Tax=Conchiformibius steedae TaxID=153493 RepID=UPI0026F28C8E